MLRFGKSVQLSIIAVILLAVTGCAGLQPQYPITNQIDPEKALIHFKDPLLANAQQIRVSHLDAYEHVEYARLETADATLEAVYDVSLGVGLVLEYDYWMAKMADTWNANSGQPKSWGSARTVNAWHGGIDYQPYRLTASNQDCAAFSSEWAYQPRDPYGRPTRVFFGYICARPGKSLTDSTVASILKSVQFSGQPVESLVPVNARRSVDQVAFSMAKGQPGSRTGNAEFPFYFGTPYVENDGDDDNGNSFKD
jgi:hypothetical protein